MSKVRPGQPWKPERALDANAKSTAADFHRRSNQNIDGQRDRRFDVNPCTAAIKNSTGADRRQFEAVALSIDLQLTATTRQNVWIDGIEPPTATSQIAILLEPVADGKWCTESQVAGVCPALVDIVDVNHRRAYLPAGEYVLKSAASGPVKIIQRPAATGEQLCIVLFDEAGAAIANFMKMRLKMVTQADPPVLTTTPEDAEYGIQPNTVVSRWTVGQPLAMVSSPAWNAPSLTCSVAGYYVFVLNWQIAWDDWKSVAPAGDHWLTVGIDLQRRTPPTSSYTAIGDTPTNIHYDNFFITDNPGNETQQEYIEHGISVCDYLDAGDEIRMIFNPTATSTGYTMKLWVGSLNVYRIY